MSSQASDAYRAVRRDSLVEGASPHDLVTMLFRGALSQIAIAQQHTNRNDPGARHRCLDKAIAIVQELQTTLRDIETDPLAGNLFTLYGFVVQQLLLADRQADDKPLQAGVDVLSTLQDAWLAIATEPPAA